VNNVARRYVKRTKTTLFVNIVLNFNVSTLSHGETILTFNGVVIDSPIDYFAFSETTGTRIKIYTQAGESRLIVSGETTNVNGFYDFNLALPIRN